MTVNQAIDKLCNWAEEQVGYRASKGKRNKYAEYIDKYPEFYNYSKNGFDWCDIFYDVGMCQCFGVETGRKMLYQPKESTGAGCDFSAGFYRANNAWSKLPQRGSQIFYGRQGSEQHTGIVVAIDGDFIWTIEGNTGGGDGMVQKKKVSKNANIAGYGIPNWSLVANVKDDSKPTSNAKEYKAIDVSVYQETIEWNKVKNDGVYAAIIRVGGRFGASGKLYTDTMADDNIIGAKKAGVNIGLYFFTQAINEKEAIEEADFSIKMAVAYGVDKKTPIFIDTEYLADGRHNNISKQTRTDVCKAFCNRIKSAGYNTGIYANYAWFKDKLVLSQLPYDIWLAQWSDSHSSIDNLAIWQYSSKGRVNGISGNVDMNKGYKNYWTGSTPVPSPTPAPAPSPSPSSKKLVEDGIFGPLSVKAGQTWLKCKYVDGIVSGQVRSMQRYVPSVTSIEWGTGGSPFVRKLQAKVGAEQDGYFGPNTSKAVQRFLNKQGYNLVVDGIWGPATSKAFQNYLNKVLNLK